MITQNFKNKYYKFILVLPLFYFLFMALSGIGTLGINVDEGDVGIVVNDFMTYISPQEYGYSADTKSYIYNKFGAFTVRLGDTSWPLMLHSYEGVVGLYPSILLLLCKVDPVLAVRLPHVLFGLFSILVIYFLIRKIFNSDIGLLTVILLATNPVFISSVRIGNFADEILQIFIFVLAILFLQKFLNTGKVKHLCLAAFISGIGVSAKFMFFGFLAGVFVVIFCLRPYRSMFFRKKFLFCSGVFFFIGCIPVIVQNYYDASSSFVSFINTLFAGDSFGHNNLKIFSNLGKRFQDLTNLVLQNLNAFIAPDFKSWFNNYASLLLFLVSFPLALLLKGRAIKLLMLGYLVLFMLTIFVPFEYDSLHLVILFPFVEIMQAYLIYNSFRCKGKYKLLTVVVLVLLSVILVKNHRNNVEIKHRIMRNQVNPEWSTLIYPVCDYLLENNIREIVTFQPLLSATPVDFLTRRKVRVFNFWNEDDKSLSKLYDWYEDVSRRKNSFYVIVGRSFEYDNTQGYDLLEKISSQNIRVDFIKSFTSKYDKIEIYKINKQKV